MRSDMVRSTRGWVWFVVGVIVLCVTPLLVTPALLAAPQVEIQFDETYDPSSTTDPRAKAQNEVIAAFERMHPDIKVNIVIDGDNSNAVRAVVAHAPAPDVLHMNTYLTPQMAGSGGLAPLD